MKTMKEVVRSLSDDLEEANMRASEAVSLAEDLESRVSSLERRNELLLRFLKRLILTCDEHSHVLIDADEGLAVSLPMGIDENGHKESFAFSELLKDLP